MKLATALFSLGLLASVSAPALAAATPEEAQRLTELFQAYLGKEPGVVTVMPEGESYRARFDAAPLFARLKEPGVSVSLTPIEWVITGQGGGTWKVDQDQPLSFAMKVDGQVEMRAEAGQVKGTGVFDEALGAFSSTSTEISRFALDQTVTEQGQQARTTYTVDSITFASTMTGSGDAADGTVTGGYKGLRQTISAPAAPDGSSPAMEFTITSPDGTQTSAVKGLKTRALADLAAWLAARPSAQAIAAEQATLKEKLGAAVPLFASISGNTTMNAVSLNSVAGTFGVSRFSVDIDANGLVAEGRLRERFGFTGLTVPAELVPPWAADIVPQNAVVDVDVSGFDLAAPTKLFIDKLDLSKDPPFPMEAEAELLAALLPTGAVKIGLGPTEIVAKVFRLGADGSMMAGPAIMPAGQALLKMTGLDQLMAALQAAPPEMGLQETAPLMLLIKGLAKPEADGTLVWSIEAAPTGTITVNGNDLSKIMGGPPQ
jgi:hypothetical protein